jgi:hypothetical protein
VSVGRLNPLMRAGFTVLPGLYDVLVGPLMRRLGLADEPAPAHDGVLFAADPASEAVRGGWLPDVGHLLRTAAALPASAGTRLLRRVR